MTKETKSKEKTEERKPEKVLARADLEEALAEHTGRERALLFSTGYMANLGVMSALLGKRDAVFEDRLNHASLLDGGLLSGARFRRFAHNDADALSCQLQRSDARRKLWWPMASSAWMVMKRRWRPTPMPVKLTMPG